MQFSQEVGNGLKGVIFLINKAHTHTMTVSRGLPRNIIPYVDNPQFVYTDIFHAETDAFGTPQKNSLYVFNTLQIKDNSNVLVYYFGVSQA